MKISVIIAYHDEEKYVQDCLSSLKEQKFRDFEAVIVCDGCKEPDVSAYGDMNVSVYHTTTESGVAAARNIGIEKAKGDYLFFLDADDYVDSELLGSLAGCACEDGIAYGNLKHTWYSRKIYLDNGKELDEKNGTTDRDDYEGDRENPFEFLVLRAGSFQSVSILGMLISRTIVADNNLRFCEELRYFSDVPFLMQALACAKKTAYCPDGLYIKRRHNDPVNLPSLLQMKDEEKKVFESMEAYRIAKSFLNKMDHPVDSKYFDYKFVRRLVTGISPFMVEAKEVKRKEAALALKDALSYLGEDVMPMLKPHAKRLVRYGKEGDGEKLAKKTKLHARKQTLKRLCRSRSKLKRYLYEKVFSKMKMLDDTVVFESFFGKSYSDSPKYIFEYLNETYPGKYKYIWVNAGRKLKLPYPAKQMKRFSFKYFYYLARCKYMVFNGRQPHYFIKRKGNVFLETWHGTPLKKLVFDMDDVTTASPLYKEQFYMQTRSWDYLVAPNAFSEEIFRHAFMYDGKMLETGYPRNDILYCNNQKQKIQEIKEELNLPLDKKVILYAPTWRDDEFYGHAQYKFTLKLDLEKMRRKLGDEYVIILRTHYFIADFLDLSEYDGFAYNLSKYDDIARLYLISDVLITDYSSVFFDYANLRRPMLFFTYDLEKYRSVLRGFYMDVEKELPGPMLFDTDEVIHAVENLEEVQKKYHDKYEVFCSKYCAWEDGRAAEKVVNAVFNG